MTIQRIAPNTHLVSHAGHYKTFINNSFIEMVDWAMRAQRMEYAG